MIDAYIDESGIHDGAFACVVAGYFGGRGLPLAEFHATDIIRKRSLQPLVNALADVIGKYKISPITRAVIVDDFNSFSEIQRRFLTGARLLDGRLVTSGCPNRPYFLPFWTCIKQVASYAPTGGEAHFFFGIDRPFYKYASASYAAVKNNGRHEYQNRLGQIAAPCAKETPQLQAADLLALLTFQHLKEVQKAGDLNIERDPLLDKCLVGTRMRDDHAYHNKRVILASLEETYRYSGRWDGTNPNVLRLSDLPRLPFESEEEEALPE